VSSPFCATDQVEGLSKYPLHQKGDSALNTNVPLSELDPQVRIHRALLLLHPCTKLWYFCRAIDASGEGKVLLPQNQWQILRESKSTIYRWLREGKELGIFRRYWWAGNTLRIILGGLFKICKVSNIKSWGTAARVYLAELLEKGRRALACAITTQDLQQRSHYAAIRQLNKLDKKTLRPPTVNQLLDDSQTSPKFTRGGIRGVIGTGDSRIFVNQRFTPFGVSQQGVCDTLNSEPTSCSVSPRTLRRHLDQLGVVKRQLVQTKPEYREIRANFSDYLCTSYTCKFNEDIYYRARGDLRLYEPNGCSSSHREGGHVLTEGKLQDKRYFGAFWMHRCNLYLLDERLTSMKYSRYCWKKIRALTKAVDSPAPPQMAESLISPAQPPALLGRGAADENKVDKNDNSPNADSDVVSDNPPSCWHEIGEKLRQMQQKKRQAKIEGLETGSLDPIREYWRQMRERP
jgi:hypothetical protein